MERQYLDSIDKREYMLFTLRCVRVVLTNGTGGEPLEAKARCSNSMPIRLIDGTVGEHQRTIYHYRSPTGGRCLPLTSVGRI